MFTKSKSIFTSSQRLLHQSGDSRRKPIEITADGRGARFDVYAVDDDKTTYNVEKPGNRLRDRRRGSAGERVVTEEYEKGSIQMAERLSSEVGGES